MGPTTLGKMHGSIGCPNGEWTKGMNDDNCVRLALDSGEGHEMFQDEMSLSGVFTVSADDGTGVPKVLGLTPRWERPNGNDWEDGNGDDDDKMLE
jgi:hypothetical protein